MSGEPTEYQTAVTLLIYTGLRRGELLGLEWKDVDFDKRFLNICRTSQYLPDKGIFTDDKNKTQRADAEASTIHTDLLKEFKVWQTAERLKVGDKWEENDRLFTQWNGKPRHPDKSDRLVQVIC